MTNKIKSFFSENFYNESSFRILYILSLFFADLCFLDLISLTVTGIFSVWAYIIMYHNLKIGKYSIKNNYLWIGLTFCVWAVIPCVIYAENTLLENLAIIFSIFIYLFMFYSMVQTSSFEKLKAEMLKFFKIFVIISTVLSVLGVLFSLIFVTMKYSKFTVGIWLEMDNRYAGLYSNPNLSAFSGVVSIMMCHFLRTTQKHTGKRYISNPWIILCCAVNLFTLFLSDSNASLILLMLYFFIYYCCVLFFRFREKKIKAVLMLLVLFLTTAVICMIVLVIRDQCQNIFSTVIFSLHPDKIALPNPGNANIPNTSAEIGRVAGQYEFTSGRLDSLQKGLRLFLQFPIFGVGKVNIVEFSNRYLEEGVLFFDLHNGYLSVLVSCGIIGFILFMIFLGLAIIRIIKALLSNIDTVGRTTIIMLFSMISSYCIFASAERALILGVSFMIAFLWLIFGYAMNYVNYYVPYEANKKRK